MREGAPVEVQAPARVIGGRLWVSHWGLLVAVFGVSSTVLGFLPCDPGVPVMNKWHIQFVWCIIHDAHFFVPFRSPNVATGYLS
jgi:hypothetical protein